MNGQQQQQQQQEGGSKSRGGRRRGNRNKSGAASSSADQPQQNNGGAAKRPAQASTEARQEKKNRLDEDDGAAPPVAPRRAPQSDAHLAEATFDSLDISEFSKRALREVLRFERMTHVQAQTLPTVLRGGDVLAKARTGSGKTVAFMLPTIENISRRKQAAGAQLQRNDISCIVLCPTRDLALQVYEEGKQLATFHRGIESACIVGGLNKSKDLRAFNGPLDILVATPGRLHDHLSTTPGFSKRMANLSVLILDEADRLLDMGFRPDIERIMSFLPRARQTLLFSATYPSALEQIVKTAMRPGFALIDTVGESQLQTNAQVAQQATVVPLEFHPHALFWLLQQHVAEMAAQPHKHKVMVFFPTARIVGFYAALFEAAGVRVLEMHSRKSQAQRGKLLDEFRAGDALIMFSSDVSARGLDVEGVTLIAQVGLTDREQYIHRLGRTARAGLSGRGVLMLAPFEQKFLGELRDLPVQALDAQTLLSKGPAPAVAAALARVDADQGLFTAAEQAYRTFLGYYLNKSKPTGQSRSQLIGTANAWSAMIGLRMVPELEAKTAGKMGLKGSTEVNIRGKNSFYPAGTQPHRFASAPPSAGSSGGRGGHGGGAGGGNRGQGQGQQQQQGQQPRRDGDGPRRPRSRRGGRGGAGGPRP